MGTTLASQIYQHFNNYQGKKRDTYIATIIGLQMPSDGVRYSNSGES